MNNIMVGIKVPNKEIVFKEIEDSVDSFYKEIKTDMLEVVYPMGKLEEQGIIIFGDEEAKLKGKDCNFWLYDRKDCFNGIAVFLKENDDSYISLKDEDKALIKEFLGENHMDEWEQRAVLNYIKQLF